jgi:hypothetical protein
MPRSPILDRQAHVVKLSDGTFADFNWNLVNTSLGAMVEPRQVSQTPRDKFVPVDLIDASVNRRIEINRDQFYGQTNTQGEQLPADYSR